MGKMEHEIFGQNSMVDLEIIVYYGFDGAIYLYAHVFRLPCRYGATHAIRAYIFRFFLSPFRRQYLCYRFYFFSSSS